MCIAAALHSCGSGDKFVSFKIASKKSAVVVSSLNLSLVGLRSIFDGLLIAAGVKCHVSVVKGPSVPHHNADYLISGPLSLKDN